MNISRSSLSIALLVGAAVSFPIVTQTNSASAATLLSENFNSVSTGQNLTSGIPSFNVIGDVDVLGSSPILFDAYPGNGNYIDLNGSRTGGLSSIAAFTFNAGDSVTIAFDYGPSGQNENFTASLGSIFSIPFSSNTLVFSKFSQTFTVSSPTTANLVFASGNSGVNGYIIDNVVLSSVSATSVPEPFTIIGTLIGGTAAVRM
uniref:hypothetical protein n=1 Tax=Chamaesiphon sp. VAR_48_metabat_403 TaxID=2964700 RepID=UPI0037BEE5A5